MWSSGTDRTVFVVALISSVPADADCVFEMIVNSLSKIPRRPRNLNAKRFEQEA